MLTVNYDLLGLLSRRPRARSGVQAPGCHAFEAFRRGARVVACDYDLAELTRMLAGQFHRPWPRPAQIARPTAPR